MERKVAVYIRFGSEAVGFNLPDEQEAFKEYMNRDKRTGPRRKVQARSNKSNRTVWRY